MNTFLSNTNPLDVDTSIQNELTDKWTSGSLSLPKTFILPNTYIYNKRYTSLSPVRYGMRVGAVSPPPPGAGPRYRSHCYWTPTTRRTYDNSCSCASVLNGDRISQISLDSQQSNNRKCIIRCTNRMNDISPDHLLPLSLLSHCESTEKCILKNKLKCCRIVPRQIYRLEEYSESTSKDNNNLDRLPIFRFGGNRTSGTPDKKTSDQKFKELTERLRKNAITTPIPPPRARHSTRLLPSVSPPNEPKQPSNRSASISQLDFLSEKYARKSYSAQNPENKEVKATQTTAVTLPRSKRRQTIQTQCDVNDLNIPPKVEDVVYNKPINGSRLSQREENPKKKYEKSRRRKGIYFSQWNNDLPREDGELVDEECTNKLLANSFEDIIKLKEDKLKDTNKTVSEETENVSSPEVKPKRSSEVSLLRSDSISENESENNRTDNKSPVSSNVSDCDSRVSFPDETVTPTVLRRFSKRPLRGPYGQMLEAEMKRPDGLKQLSDFNFVDDTMPNKPKHKYKHCNLSLDETQSQFKEPEKLLQPVYTYKNNFNFNNDENFQNNSVYSPSKSADFTSTEISSELLEQLLRGSSEHLATAEANQQQNDTRTHIVVELYDNERIYVESLQTIVKQYLEPLKLPENIHLLDTSLVDEIFYQIPFLLNHHESFLLELKTRLEQWDVKQKIGDIFLERFSKSAVIENYTNYVNNWKRARDVLKNAQQSKPAFAKFLENTSREHKGKLALDSLLIKPIQKFPKYELLLQRLIKHTDINHPDHSILLSAQKQVHEQLIKINCTERETLELEHLREIESLIEGLMTNDLASGDRHYIRHDLVTMVASERALFLFSDTLLVTSIKRRSGRRIPSTGQGSVVSTLEANKYKLLIRVPLQDLDIVRPKDENVKQIMQQGDNLAEDIHVLNQINELGWTLHCNHMQLDEVVKEMLVTLNKQLIEQQNCDSQMSCLDLMINTSNGQETLSVVFSNTDKRTSWEESFNEAKQKLAISTDKKPCPELMAAVPIRKTRAGLQFTCAAPTLDGNGKHVWVCNSDGYVGQVCILSLNSEPTVTSCNGVCNAKINCIASVPALTYGDANNRNDNENKTMQYDTTSSSEDDDKMDSDQNNKSNNMDGISETFSLELEDTDGSQSTMWLGTEDGCIHVYNSSDNVRIKKNKIKIHHGFAILCMIYLDNKIYVSLGNGDIIIYERDHLGFWNINSPNTITLGSQNMPVTRIEPSSGKLWCACGNVVKIFNTQTQSVETSFTVSNDNNKPVNCIVLHENAVWISMQNSAILKCYHLSTFELFCEINVSLAVTKMLTSCDDIIKQHKSACLRVTALMACKDLLWIGTSAGVLLTMPLPHISSTTTKITTLPTVNGVTHGHTGHVRFLTCVEINQGTNGNTYQANSEDKTFKLLLISGGDGYEDFRTSNVSEVAGREDSTNHLLLWNI